MKIYVDTADGLLDSVALASTAGVLTQLADVQDEVTFTGDGEGHYFEVSDELGEAFLTQVNGPAKKKPGPKPKTAPVEDSKKDSEE